VDLQDGQRAAWVAGGDHVDRGGAGHLRDGGDPVGQLAGQPPSHRGPIGHADHVDPATVDGHSSGDIVNQRGEVPDVVDPGGRGGSTVVPNLVDSAR
jgi:hypothetical protein